MNILLESQKWGNADLCEGSLSVVRADQLL